MRTLVDEGCNFGASNTLLDDLDGDGRRELGVTAPYAFLMGAFWIVSLDANEQVKSARQFGARR